MSFKILKFGVVWQQWVTEMACSRDEEIRFFDLLDAVGRHVDDPFPACFPPLGFRDDAIEGDVLLTSYFRTIDSQYALISAPAA